MTTKKRLLVYIVLLATLLSVPWLNALTSSFVLKGQLEDREINFVGSHGRYKIEANYTSNTHIVHTGYYASLFDTLYLIKVRRDKVATDSAFDVSEFVRGHQTFILFKLKHEQGNVYQMKRIEEDPRNGISQYPVTIVGDLGIL
ncbi:conserved hypothetical protein [Vibrio owensii]|uniref:hypothetical protein n=1 Tax=Vibrio owensii TaxID=696485 RepID=UPI002894DB08|nr:conserved hypothetical protein [Vibrio owensii]CAH1550816.1 conserved hypothetical protein [Vibrio owensii]